MANGRTERLICWRLFSKRDDNVLEVGSNIGPHTVFIARDICPSGIVYAFEPRRETFQNLCANIVLNSLTNVHAYQLALGNSRATLHEGSIPGDEILYKQGCHLGAYPGSDEIIEVLPLDEMINSLRKISLIKIDVEGHELDVLSGAEKVIARDRPALYLENDRLDTSDALIGHIKSRDYDLWWHTVPLFRYENLGKTKFNIFSDWFSCNMICFPKEKSMTMQNLRKIDKSGYHPMRRSAPSQTVNTEPAGAKSAETSVRRNEPCPCGSGKKYKHCHGKTS